ncbi:hypothetical protein EGM_12882, partial [Macaca fascicularis]
PMVDLLVHTAAAFSDSFRKIRGLLCPQHKQRGVQANQTRVLFLHISCVYYSLYPFSFFALLIPLEQKMTTSPLPYLCDSIHVSVWPLGEVLMETRMWKRKKGLEMR